MRARREHGAHGNDTAAGDSQRAATPGKHTLTETLAPVQRKAESLGDIALPVQCKADGATHLSGICPVLGQLYPLRTSTNLIGRSFKRRYVASWSRTQATWIPSCRMSRMSTSA